MKRFAFAAIAASMIAAPVMAQDSVVIPLSGELEKDCNISAFLNGPFDVLNMESTAVQGGESVTINCNYGGTASVEFASANGGTMDSGANSVPYNFLLAGTSLSGGVSLASPQTVTNFPATVNTDQSRTMSVQLTSAATVAGIYTDTITATVTPN